MGATVDIASMSTVEKLRLMEDLWQDLTHENPELPSPAWHGDVLNERERLTASGEEAPIDWEVAKRHLRDELQ